jgi:hypothetical protein
MKCVVQHIQVNKRDKLINYLKKKELIKIVNNLNKFAKHN